MKNQTFPGRTLSGRTVTVACPPWCTFPHHEWVDTWAFHETDSAVFIGPADHSGFDGGKPYDALWACVSAEAHEDGGYGRPYLHFDTIGAGAGGRLDVAQTDALLAELRRYTGRLQQLRDQLAKITTEGEQ
ncbi:DUF6907 domain-containing protein [Streptomyces iconiensis]|uniref:Uncharacterized protein n=1 Tax=Streptomyces iconiensis TaxID=1384038 RepID=A0ABT6ZRU4_9ACTN|nr:hypothetical protein [Streptomyces iconiensis]MDJ1131779.1 hypothetical protein [Streptomyces iconiensis]